jgi:hypothetical protein
MFDKRRVSEEAARSSLPTIHSSEDRRHGASKPIRRAETAPISNSKASASMKRKGSTKPNMLGRSDTLSSKPPLTRMPSIQTRYMQMLLHLDEIPRLYNILASLFTWVILAGFLVVPGTFTTFKESKAFQDADNNDNNNEITHAIVHSIAHIGLLWLAGAFCVVGVVGCVGLWFRWRENYVWLINRIFLYDLLSNGLISLTDQVFTVQSP